MELKQAMEAATADLDVRPGFVGDVMAGGRRRHTRKLLALTAAVALLAGVTTGVVLTRSSTSEPDTGDPRLTAATSGDLAGDEDFIARTLVAWKNARNESWMSGQDVTEVSGTPNVFWAANTVGGQAALVAQAVRVRNSNEPQTLVGLVAAGAVEGREVVHSQSRDQETGLYRLGAHSSTYVVLSLGQRVFWSVNPVRGPDNRLRRDWRQADDPDGVAVVTAQASERPVILRSATAPAPDDFTRQPLQNRARTGFTFGQAFTPHPGLGWSGQRCTDEKRPALNPKSESAERDLQERGLLDYQIGDDSSANWAACAWTPDLRFVRVFESYGQLYGVLYDANGVFSAAVLGGPAVKGAPLPVRLVLPDGQGTLVAEFGTLLGPQERPDVWLAPAGTTAVTVRRGDTPEVVPLG